MFFFDVVRYIPRIPQNGEKRVEKKEEFGRRTEGKWGERRITEGKGSV